MATLRLSISRRALTNEMLIASLEKNFNKENIVICSSVAVGNLRKQILNTLYAVWNFFQIENPIKHLSQIEVQ